MKKYILIICCILINYVAFASERSEFYKHFDYGVEWGYSMTVFQQYHYNYSNAIGSRVDSKLKDLTYKSNGHLTFFAGARFARYFSADFHTGYIGIFEGRRVIPATLRGSYFLNGHSKDGFKFFAEGGLCLAKSFENQNIHISKYGTGYRIMLDKFMFMDLSISWQLSKDHPVDVYDRSNHTVIDSSSLLRSDTEYQSVNFSISLIF